MKTLILIGVIAIILLSSCSKNKAYNVTSITQGNEIVISSEHLVKGDTVHIGYDVAGREVASKDFSGSCIGYIGHIAIVDSEIKDNVSTNQ